MPDPLIELPLLAGRMPSSGDTRRHDKASLKHVYRLHHRPGAPPPQRVRVGSTSRVNGAIGQRSPSTETAKENTEVLIKEFRRDGFREDGHAILPLVLEEDKAILRNLGKLRYTQHQVQEKEAGSSSQELKEATALFHEQLCRFHKTHTEAIATYLPQMCAPLPSPFRHRHTHPCREPNPASPAPVASRRRPTSR